LFPPAVVLTRLISAVLAFVALVTAAAASIALQVSPAYGIPRQFPPGTTIVLKTDSAQGSTYQWFHDGALMAGATLPTLTLTNLITSNSGNYSLQVTTNGRVEQSEFETINVIPLPPSPVDPTFKADLDPTASVYSVGPFANDGSVIIITSTDQTTWGAVRLSPTGSRVAGFAFPSSGGRVLAGFGNGDLIASLPPFRFNANGSPTTFMLPAPFDSSKALSKALVQPNGKFLLAQGKLLARFNPDGSVDSTFTYSAEASGVTQVQNLQVDEAGRIYVSATRLNPVPSNFPASWTVFFRLAVTGERDRSFLEQASEPLLYGTFQITPLRSNRLLYYSAYHGYRLWKLLREDGTADPGWSGSVTFTERPIVVDPATDQVYVASTSGNLLRYKISATGLTLDETFYPGFSSFASVLPSVIPHVAGVDERALLLAGNFDLWDGFATKGAVRLRTDDPVSPPPLVARIVGATNYPAKGNVFTLGSSVSGPGPFLYTWSALDGQPLPASTTSEKLELANFSEVNLGRYQFRATRADGVSVLSDVIKLQLSPQLPYLANLSGRAMTGSGEDTVIAGLVTKISAGALGLPTLLRGAGPALQPLGVSNFLPNPAIDVVNSSGVVIANNDQWSSDPGTRTAAMSAGAFAFADASNDAALLRSFPTGTATLMLRSQGQGDGIGLLEIYQLFPNGSEYGYQSLMNLSFRAKTGPGDNVTIAGFVIVDPQNFKRSARVLLRAIGPTLSTQGIAHPLENPILTVYDRLGNVVAQNDDWGLNTTLTERDQLAAAMKQVGAFDLPSNSTDSALLLDLPAGPYSMHATGGTGVVLLEVYHVR
ncbi:MAG: delta-60 repeat domain-containing protein, partial [Opitutus sp.]